MGKKPTRRRAGAGSRNQTRDETRMGRMLKSVLFGLAAALISCTLMLVLCSVVVSMRDIPHTVIVLFSIACTVVGAFSGSFLSAKLIRERGMVIGLVTGILFYLAVLLVNLTIGVSGTGLFSLSRLAVILVTSAIGGILGVNAKRKLRA